MHERVRLIARAQTRYLPARMGSCKVECCACCVQKAGHREAEVEGAEARAEAKAVAAAAAAVAAMAAVASRHHRSSQQANMLPLMMLDCANCFACSTHVSDARNHCSRRVALHHEHCCMDFDQGPTCKTDSMLHKKTMPPVHPTLTSYVKQHLGLGKGVTAIELWCTASKSAGNRHARHHNICMHDQPTSSVGRSRPVW